MGKVPAVRQARNESYSFLRRYPHLRASMTLKDKLRVGCSGWGYDDWLGGFYPPDTPKSDYLKLYSSVFDCVEVDSSFYRNPGPAMTKGWYKSTPPGFLFAMKMPDRKSTRLNSSHRTISYAVFCLKKKKKNNNHT